MTTRSLVDTSVLIAGTFRRDQHSDLGQEIVRSLDHGSLPRALVPSPVLGELLDYTLERNSPEAATELLDRLQDSVGFELVHPLDRDHRAARRLFRRYETLGLTDATLVALGHRTGVGYLYSFDDDFDRVTGVTRLNSAVNPYGAE